MGQLPPGAVSAPKLPLPTAGYLGPRIWQGETPVTCLRTNPPVESVLRGKLGPRLREWSAAGFRCGLTLDLGRVHPLQPEWDEGHLLRDPTGAIVPAPENTYRLKTWYQHQLAGPFAAALASQGAGLVRLRDGTALPLGDRVDYDPRVPGAGTWSQGWYDGVETVAAIGEAVDLPVVATAGSEWLAAGLVDAIELIDAPGAHPWFPVFARGHVSPWTLVIAPVAEDEELDRALATTLAYGWQTRVGPTWTAGRARRVSFMMHAIQRRALGQPVVQLRYRTDLGLAPLARALRDDQWRRSQLYLLLGDALELWINGHPEEVWTVELAGRDYELPPFGWLVRGDDLFAFSGLYEGRRIDFVESPDYLFMDPREAGEIEFKGQRTDEAFVEIGGERTAL